MFIALALAGAALTVALYQALLSGVDDAAARRVGDVVAGLGLIRPRIWTPRSWTPTSASSLCRYSTPTEM